MYGCFNELTKSVRVARKAGARPNNIPLIMQTMAVKAITRTSRCNSRSIFARPLVNRASNTLPAHLAITRPSNPPQHASNMLSVSSWRISRVRRAPRLSRTAISRCRALARVNRSAATLPQAISKTAPTIIISNSNELENCRLKLSRPCLTGTTRSAGFDGRRRGNHGTKIFDQTSPAVQPVLVGRSAPGRRRPTTPAHHSFGSVRKVSPL